jgi:hypothetical protein
LQDVVAERPQGVGTIAKFVLRVVVFGALLFPAWHVSSGWVARPVAKIAAALAESAAPIRAAFSIRSGADVAYEVSPSAAAVIRGLAPANLVADIPVNALKYTYGLPFFLALLLASLPRGAAWKAAAGAGIILLLASIAVACDILVQAQGVQGPDGARPFALGTIGDEIAALGYQLGVLIFPTVVPVVLWGAFTKGALGPARPA